MQLRGSQFVFSATDLSHHLSCRHLTQLNRQVALEELQRPFRNDPLLETLIERGRQHEAAYVAYLKASGMNVVDVGLGNDRAERTLQAMKNGADVIVQAELRSDRWLGYADLLLRVIGDSDLGDWSYEVADTKLSRNTKGTTVLQLCLYSQLLADLQGVMPEQMQVIMPGAPFELQSFRVDEYLAYARLVQSQLEAAVLTAPETYPEPVAHCEICNWWKECNQRRRDDDHLSFVAGIRSGQIVELTEQNRPTLKAFAESTQPLDRRPKRGSAETYHRVHKQAQLQHTARQNGTLELELLPPDKDRGFALLPEPNAADIFFDIEGARNAPGGGLEYLLGLILIDSDQPVYQEHWALNRAQEKVAFEAFIDHVMQRWQQHPSMHVYHYAHYEKTALQRLAMKHATREYEVDRLLRAEKLIDLYAVVRQSLQASVESYSIKKLEPFYGYVREAELGDARVGLQRLEQALDLGDPASVLPEDQETVKIYNRDDCLSTLKLRDWLEQLRERQIQNGYEIARPELKDGEPGEETEQRNDAVREVFKQLIEGLRETHRTSNEQARWLLAYLLDYFGREDKCVWWERFRMHELQPHELLEEKTGIAGLEFVSEVPGGERDRNPTHRYRFPMQEAHFDHGASLIEVGGSGVGTVANFDSAAGILDIKKRGDSIDVHPTNVFAFDRIRPEPLPDSLLAFAISLLQHPIEEPPETARYALLAQQTPRLRTLTLPQSGDIVDVAIRVVSDLQNSVLPIQGPPGAGKTYLGGHVIASLVAKGHRVGVTAVSHKVISNLLASVVKASKEPIVVGQKFSTVPDDKPEPIVALKDAEAALKLLGNHGVVGGTAWMWAGEAMEQQLDYLFIDEAGQMSLAIALAAGRAAKNIVLLGDPQQLEQPQQGTHPEGAEVAALSYMLKGSQTIPEDRGLFIGQTWRLHPSICRFTSEQFYEGRLSSRPGLESQVTNGSATLPSSGLVFVPVEHQGNQNGSEEEAAAIATIVQQLTDGHHTWTNTEGKTATITLQDIVIVAPYNAQCALLRKHLPADARVGTVDKFQGQEAAIVIYSMASSSAEDAPRGMSFLYSPNRLNVATSRAQCLAILVASPRVFEPDCASPEHMKLANAFCRYLEMAIVVDPGTLRVL